MKSDDLKERSQSILGADEAAESLQSQKETNGKIAPEDRKRVRSLALTAGISLLVVAAVLVFGIIYGSREQQKQAAREPRESTPTFYGSLEDDKREAGKVASAITQAYYTAENGLMVVVEFGNDMETTQHISKVIITISTEDGKQIAKAQSAGMNSDFVVAAGETNEITMYIEPEYVSITDDPLETLQYEITVDHEARE